MKTTMGISEAKAKYNASKFGNPPCKIGNYVWIKEYGSEYPVTVREDTAVEKKEWDETNRIRQGGKLKNW